MSISPTNGEVPQRWPSPGCPVAEASISSGLMHRRSRTHARYEQRVREPTLFFTRPSYVWYVPSPTHRLCRPSSLDAVPLGRFCQTTNARPAARSIKPPMKMSAIGAPVLARLPVDATGCVPADGSDDVVTAPMSLVVVAGVLVTLSDGLAPGDGDASADGPGDGKADGDVALPVL
jgi:hypothetical protein